MAPKHSKSQSSTLPQIVAMTRSSRAGVVLAGLLSLPTVACGSEESDPEPDGAADLGTPEVGGDTEVDTDAADDVAEDTDAPAPDGMEDPIPQPLYGGPPDTELDIVEDVPAPDVTADASLDVEPDGSDASEVDTSEDAPTLPPYGIPPDGDF